MFDFDTLPDRHASDSVKWHYFEPDVIPMWVADMDFRSPEAVMQALQQRVAHGIFGYPMDPPELKEVIIQRMVERYGWQIATSDVIFVPGVVTGFQPGLPGAGERRQCGVDPNSGISAVLAGAGQRRHGTA